MVFLPAFWFHEVAAESGEGAAEESVQRALWEPLDERDDGPDGLEQGALAPYWLGQLGPGSVDLAPAGHRVADVTAQVPVRTHPQDSPL